MKRVAVFVSAESGAVTVDWVVLTAGIVGLGMATMGVVSGGVSDLSGDVDTQLTDQEITTEFAAAGGVDWVSGQWEMNNPGIYEEYTGWMAGFEDQQLLNHMNNMAQYSEAPPGSGHPVDTYHDEYWIARDEAITRGLVDPNA
ncbi:hypothetical protein N8I71_14995 [Roseibacterium sp. SDUM158016]|jgi:hypothetical protein|uniref:hypothetical protein n=1 Tax=Roseicyclus sediminis TaxID=2980997 RepID=UPI0021CDEE44|nr:hypothetical protein [Roseibacterium sp. SDUM158016]MCU4654150.1 hypothetical protein [Roseibacterium sp. SDUM158016]